MTNITFPDEAQAFLEKAIKQIKIRKIVINCFLFSIPVILCIISLYTSVRETNIARKQFLSANEYTERIHDCFLEALVIWCFGMLFMVALAIAMTTYMNRYIEVITRLSKTDLLKLKTMNEGLLCYQKYWTPYIINKQEVVVFELLTVKYFNINKLNFITITRRIVKGGFVYIITAGANNDENKLKITGMNIFLAENLIKEVLAVNPKIKVKRWND
ncbi:hypothetical protein [Flavobacterium chilense]|uniref:Uncharacterized protein n=1 Tax=Flavobacterium chilense TaxID=946677 RepID=A0A1M7F5I4_9FLAO|nr:hypothetical protein [Flavobacterium chilense]SHL99312.1 hypothetical protein SAMN05444484_103235 [Flavobacterium chilense]